jgi:hypothetical protein
MKPTSPKDLLRFVQLTRSACYDSTTELKNEYKRLGRKILKELAANLNIATNCDIRFNPGGIACSGDHTLHGDNIYVALHDNIGSGWFYYRSCKGRQDYCGGQNRIVTWEKFLKIGIGGLADEIRVNVLNKLIL